MALSQDKTARYCPNKTGMWLWRRRQGLAAREPPFVDHSPEAGRQRSRQPVDLGEGLVQSPLSMKRIVMGIRALPHIDPAGSPPPVVRHMPQPKDGGSETTRLTVSLSTELVERLRDTVFAISQGTLSGLVTQAIEEALRQLETHHGGRFPRRTRELKAGRPRKKKDSPQAAVSIATLSFNDTNRPLMSSCDRTCVEEHDRSRRSLRRAQARTK